MLENICISESKLLDLFSYGVVVVNSRFTVEFANESARKLIDAADGLRVGRDGLEAATEADTRRLRWLIYEAIGAACGERKDYGGGLRIGRRNSGEPLFVFVVPLGTAASRMEARAAIFLSRSDVPLLPSAIAQLYELTGAESRLTAALAAGQTVSQYAGSVGISVGTARIHLKNVLRKFGVKRQADMLRLLLAGPAGLVLPTAASQERDAPPPSVP